MKTEFFEAVFGKDVSLALREEAVRRTNLAAWDWKIVGTSAWESYCDREHRELILDYICTHPITK